MTKRITFIGYYGANFGDLLMLEAAIKIFGREGWVVSIATYAETLPKLTERAAVFVDKVITLSGVIGFHKNFKDSDAVVWIGGTCFMDQGGTGGLKYMLASKIFGAKVGYLAVGVGDINKKKSQWILRMAHAISSIFSVRDPRSYSIMTGKLGLKNVEQVVDLAYAYDCCGINKFLDEPHDSGIKSLLVAHRGMTEYLDVKEEQIFEEKILNEILDVIKKFDISEVNFIVTDRDIDLFATKRILEKLDGELTASAHGNSVKVNIKEWATVSDFIKIMQQSDFLYTGRLHVGLMSERFRVPFSVVKYSPKVDQMLENIGLMCAGVDINNIWPGSILMAIKDCEEAYNNFSGGYDNFKHTAEKHIQLVAISGLK